MSFLKAWTVLCFSCIFSTSSAPGLELVSDRWLLNQWMIKHFLSSWRVDRDLIKLNEESQGLKKPEMKRTPDLQVPSPQT